MTSSITCPFLLFAPFKNFFTKCSHCAPPFVPPPSPATLCQILRDPAGERYRGHLAALGCRSPESALLKLGSQEMRCMEVRELDVNANPRLFIVHVNREMLSR